MIKSYKKVINFLYEKLPMFQRDGRSAYKANLDNSIELDNYFNNPHKNFKTIHVGGTNGKGSVSHIIASVLQEAGYKVGLYTSPHLKDFRERIKINGEMISEDDVVDFVNDNYEMIKNISPSFFELTVSMAFSYFAQKEVDFAVVEVGLGGRLDSTNVVTPEISVITNVGIDHVSILGDNIKTIAVEKAGIIKENKPVVIGKHNIESDEVFNNKAADLNSEIYYSQDFYLIEMMEISNNYRRVISKDKDGNVTEFFISLLGLYQQNNLSLVLKVADVLIEKGYSLNKDIIAKGVENVVKNTNLLGRWQIINESPKIIVDTGHNEDAILNIVNQINEESYKNLHIIFGMADDKEIDNVLSLLPKEAIYHFVNADSPRSISSNELRNRALKFDLHGESYPSVNSALNHVKNIADLKDLIFIGGSTFVVAEII